MLGVMSSNKEKDFILIFFYFSRYDTKSHQLTDYPAEGRSQEIFPGQDYNNPRVKDFLNGIYIKKLILKW